jgi:hypothetical protein
MRLWRGSIEERSGVPHPIHAASMRELDLADFADGSMRPKVKAACRFASETGKMAAIGALADASAILDGRAGTRIVAESTESAIGATEDAFERLQEREEEIGRDIRTATRLVPTADDDQAPLSRASGDRRR